MWPELASPANTCGSCLPMHLGFHREERPPVLPAGRLTSHKLPQLPHLPAGGRLEGWDFISKPGRPGRAVSPKSWCIAAVAARVPSELRVRDNTVLTALGPALPSLARKCLPVTMLFWGPCGILLEPPPLPPALPGGIPKAF